MDPLDLFLFQPLTINKTHTKPAGLLQFCENLLVSVLRWTNCNRDTVVNYFTSRLAFLYCNFLLHVHREGFDAKLIYLQETNAL